MSEIFVDSLLHSRHHYGMFVKFPFIFRAAQHIGFYYLCFIDEETGSEELSYQPKITYLGRGKAWLRGQVCLIPKSKLLH